MHKKKLVKILEKYVKGHSDCLQRLDDHEERTEQNGSIGKRKSSLTSIDQKANKKKKGNKPVQQEDSDDGEDIHEGEDKKGRGNSNEADSKNINKTKSQSIHMKVNSALNSNYSRRI